MATRAGLNYYGKFITNLATFLVPLYRLLQIDTEKNQGKSQYEAFTCTKDILQSLHADFAGPFQGHMFLARCSCDEVHIILCNNPEVAIHIHGLHHKLVTDNGPAFISSEFKTFMDINGIIHAYQISTLPSQH